MEDDPLNLAYLSFLALGMGTLLPWNAFISASDYFEHVFTGRHCDRLITGGEGGWGQGSETRGAPPAGARVTTPARAVCRQLGRGVGGWGLCAALRLPGPGRPPSAVAARAGRAWEGTWRGGGAPPTTPPPPPPPPPPPTHPPHPITVAYLPVNLAVLCACIHFHARLRPALRVLVGFAGFCVSVGLMPLVRQ